MRILHTFILRLLVDSADPEALRGALQDASQNQAPQPFIGETALLGLLKRMVTPDEQPGSPHQEHKETLP